MPIHEQSSPFPNRKCQFKQNLLMPILEVGKDMQGIMRTQNLYILLSLNDAGRISQIQTIAPNCRQRTHVKLFFATTNKEQVDISRHVVPKNSTVTGPMHPTLKPAASSWQQIDNIQVSNTQFWPPSRSIDWHLISTEDARAQIQSHTPSNTNGNKEAKRFAEVIVKRELGKRREILRREYKKRKEKAWRNWVIENT